jgi:hypothetical protein
VIPVVVGSSPISHPKELSSKSKVTRVKLVAFFVCLMLDRTVSHAFRCRRLLHFISAKFALTVKLLNQIKISSFTTMSPSYFWAGAQDGNLTSFAFYTSNNAFNLDTANDFLNVVSVRGIVRSASNVPEPSSLALFGIAMLGLTTIGLRKRFK